MSIRGLLAVDMEAILISQEGIELPLLSKNLYKVGSARNDDIFVLHDEVRPYHVQLVYDMKANAWNMILRDAEGTQIQTGFQQSKATDGTNPTSSKEADAMAYLMGRYNRDVIKGEDNEITRNEPIQPVIAKIGIQRIAFVKRSGSSPIKLKPKDPFPLQNNDILILGNAESGYRILYKESESPFPKQYHPPEPYGEWFRIRQDEETNEKTNKELFAPPIQ